MDIRENEFKKNKTIREYKGKNLLEIPKSYCIVDVETTGFSPKYDYIIEVGCIKVQNGAIVSTYSSLVKPFESNDNLYVDEYISELTGITNEMLSTAPVLKQVLSEFINFVGEDIIIGHNVNFDINFLYDACLDELNYKLTNDFVDTMRIFKRLHPELEHHTLKDMCNFYSVEYNRFHRSLCDCELTNGSYQKIIDEIESNDISLEAFKKKHNHAPSVKAKDIETTITEFDSESPLYGKVCVFTGALEKMLRKDAMQIVADMGGINGDGVTKKTNYLILGNNDYCSSIKDGKSSKQKKAEELKLKGNDIEIIPESVFYDMINDYLDL